MSGDDESVRRDGVEAKTVAFCAGSARIGAVFPGKQNHGSAR